MSADALPGTIQILGCDVGVVFARLVVAQEERVRFPYVTPIFKGNRFRTCSLLEEHETFNLANEGPNPSRSAGPVV